MVRQQGLGICDCRKLVLVHSRQGLVFCVRACRKEADQYRTEDNIRSFLELSHVKSLAQWEELSGFNVLIGGSFPWQRWAVALQVTQQVAHFIGLQVLEQVLRHQ